MSGCSRAAPSSNTPAARTAGCAPPCGGCIWTSCARDGRTQELTELADDSRFEEHLADQDAALQLHRILHQLPEPYKEVFSLRVFGQLSCTQIAQVFGRSENWSGSPSAGPS